MEMRKHRWQHFTLLEIGVLFISLQTQIETYEKAKKRYALGSKDLEQTKELQQACLWLQEELDRAINNKLD